MDKQQLFIKMAADAWDFYVKRTSDIFEKMTDEDLMQEIAPGRNRGIYLLGHLTAVHDGMLPLLGFGNREFTNLDEAFIKNPDRTITSVPSAKELRAAWIAVNKKLAEQFSKQTPADWFGRHTRISEEDFAKEPHRNKLNVLISRTNHLASHVGQLLLLTKKSEV